MRGLKYQLLRVYFYKLTVALYTSAWIEIIHTNHLMKKQGVALYTSAWIEIQESKADSAKTRSRTLHECVD